MRVIAGLYRSRPLQAPPGVTTRPTSDRLRETIFNVLAPRMEGSRFLDFYAGSGAVGIEAVSRGASQVDFVEKAPPALKVLRENLAKLKITGGVTVHSATATAFLRGPGRPFDVIFLDPPYDLEAEYTSVLGTLGRSASEWLSEGAIVIAEHRRKDELAESYGALQRTRLLQQGDAALSFYAISE